MRKKCWRKKAILQETIKVKSMNLEFNLLKVHKLHYFLSCHINIVKCIFGTTVIFVENKLQKTKLGNDYFYLQLLNQSIFLL